MRLPRLLVIALLGTLAIQSGAVAAKAKKPPGGKPTSTLVRFDVARIPAKALQAIVTAADAEDALGDTVLISSRTFRDSGWKLDRQRPLQSDAGGLITFVHEETIKVDRKRHLECRLAIPTKKGKFLVAVRATTLTIAPDFRCAFNMAQQFVYADTPEPSWPELGAAVSATSDVRPSLSIATNAKLAKQGDKLLHDAQDMVELHVQVLGADGVELAHATLLGKLRGESVDFTSAAKLSFPAKEGDVVTFRAWIWTEKGNLVEASGQAWPIYSLTPGAPSGTLQIDADLVPATKKSKVLPVARAKRDEAAKPPADQPAP